VLEAGASWRLTVKAAGTTDYACLFHPTMTGRIVVR
jgi:plastocyanin